MKKFLLIALFPILSFAQNSYLCVPTSSTGFKFDSNTKKWNRKFLSDDLKQILIKTDGDWKWKNFGQEWGLVCNKDFEKDGLLICPVIGGEVKFNKKTLRYIQTYTMGYIEGIENNKSDTPGMTIGTCSPL